MATLLGNNIVENFQLVQKFFAQGFVEGAKPMEPQRLKAALAIQSAYVTLNRIQVQRERQIIGAVKDFAKDKTELKKYIRTTMPELKLLPSG